MVPALKPLLRSAVHDDAAFSVQNGAFPLPDLDDQSLKFGTRATSQDPFLGLPKELNYSVIEHLGSRDIANLRLASRAFRQLPISLWHRLLRQEMPWLWEMWSDDEPYYWTTVSVAQLKAAQDGEAEHQRQLRIYREVIREEMPWLLQDWCDAEPSYRDIVLKESSSPAEPPCLKLPRANTDWYQLYHDITIHWDELKGLQNRRRIWKDVEEIISRITRYREAGRILD